MVLLYNCYAIELYGYAIKLYGSYATELYGYYEIELYGSDATELVPTTRGPETPVWGNIPPTT